MVSRHPTSSLALLIVLLLSLMAVGVHVATHASADLQSCELCSGHGNPAHAIPVAAPESIPTTTAVPGGVLLPVSLAVPSTFHFHQRAPPHIA